MNSIRQALQQLDAEEHLIRTRSIGPDIGHHAVRDLAKTLEQLRATLSKPKIERPKLDVDGVWQRFAATDHTLGNLDAHEFQTLCAAPETAVRREFISALQKEPQRLLRSRFLYGIVNGYFSSWRSMPAAEEAERLILSVLAVFSRKNLVVEKWKSNPVLFSEKAATYLCNEICTEQRSVDDVLHSYNVGLLTDLGKSIRSSAATVAVRYLQNVEVLRDEKWTLQYLKWMTDGVLAAASNNKSFYEAISTLILSLSAKRSQAFQKTLRDYIQNHRRLGDPRFRESMVNWRSIAPEAAQRYLSWLARDSILFFFNTILPNTNENRRRKDFWLRYHGSIRDFQVALSDADVWKVEAHQSSDVLSYSRLAHATTSAFLMKFEGYRGSYLVVEFSETGNAAYIFSMAEFENKHRNLRTPRFELRSDLKFDGTHRILHVADWEPKASYRLSAEFGIRP